MKSIFASRKGRVAKKLSIVVATLSVIMFLINGYISGEQESNQVAAAEAAQQEENLRPEIGNRVIYGTGTELDADGNPVPTSSATPTPDPNAEEDTEAIITGEVRTQATEFGSSWTTYDFATPPALETLPGAATDGEMKAAYDSWISGMQSRQERSSGTVSGVAINNLEYTGSAANGKGTATVTVSTTSTVSNSEVGAAGSQVQKDYVLTMVRDDQTRDSGSDYKWIITNVTEK